MLLEFIGAVVIAIGAGGLAHFAQRILRGRLPGWIVPASAGGAMIAFVVYMEYSWVGRVLTDLPPEVSVASQNATTAWFRPWTFVWPMTNRITLIDHRYDRRNPAAPDLLMTAVVMLGRWEPVRQVPVVFDCALNRRADLRSDVVLTEDGGLDGATWLSLPPDDPVLRAACDGG